MVLNGYWIEQDRNFYLKITPKRLVNFHIKPEKTLKKRILGRQEQSHAQFLGNHLFSSRLYLLAASKGADLLRKAYWLSVSRKNLAALLRISTTKHLNGVYEQPALGFLVVTWT